MYIYVKYVSFMFKLNAMYISWLHGMTGMQFSLAAIKTDEMV